MVQRIWSFSLFSCHGILVILVAKEVCPVFKIYGNVHNTAVNNFKIDPLFLHLGIYFPFHILFLFFLSEISLLFMKMVICCCRNTTAQRLLTRLCSAPLGFCFIRGICARDTEMHIIIFLTSHHS